MGGERRGMERMASNLGLRRPVAVERLMGGLGSPPLAVTCGDRRVVVKRFGADLDAALREHANLVVAHELTVATPEPLRLDSEGAWFGEVALAISFIDGKPGFPDANSDRWTRDLALALAAAHDAPARASDVEHPHRLLAWINAEADNDERLRRVQAAWDRRIEDEDVVFSHGDFHPGNVLFDNGSLAGIVDWLDAGARSRASDVAYCRGVLAVHPGGEVPDRFLAAYEAELGRHVDCDAWDALWGARGLRGAHGRWPEAFAALGVTLSPTEIWTRSALWTDRALDRSGD